ncbi:MAG: hypothetical protein AAFZ52_18100, partial [Bacteroidota bacterium]
LVNIGQDGAITNVTTVGMDATEDKNPDNNLVVVGYGLPGQEKSELDPALFGRELDRMINRLAPFTPAKINGQPTAVLLEFDFRFKLE